MLDLRCKIVNHPIFVFGLSMLAYWYYYTLIECTFGTMVVFNMALINWVTIVIWLCLPRTEKYRSHRMWLVGLTLLILYPPAMIVCLLCVAWGDHLEDLVAKSPSKKGPEHVE